MPFQGVVVALVLAALAVLANAQTQAQATPVGLWKTIDDDSKAEKSLVRITESAGVLSGAIEKLLDPAVAPGAVCTKCSDDRQGKPLLGLSLLRNVRHSADDPAVWDGGEILDPAKGKTYKVRLKPQDGGKALEVRGYIGPFFRNQTWLRVE